MPVVAVAVGSDVYRPAATSNDRATDRSRRRAIGPTQSVCLPHDHQTNSTHYSSFSLSPSGHPSPGLPNRTEFF